jgi:hypothetical protein
MVVGTVAGMASASCAPFTAAYAVTEPATKQMITISVKSCR